MMKAYDEYKDTGLNWCAKVPTHWNIKRNKEILEERKEKSLTGDGQLLSLSQYRGITLYKDGEQEMGRAESLVGYNRVYERDIVMNIMLAWNGSTAMSELSGLISPAYSVYYTKNADTDEKYLHYLYKLPSVMKYFQDHSTGIIMSRLRLYPNIFLKLYSIFPPYEEQQQIVSYLDDKVAKINQLIENKQKEISVLEEYRQGVINKAVTKGLNPDVEMKDSGIEWIGKIPSSWKVLRCKYLFTETNHRSENGEEQHLSMSQKYGLVPDNQLDERRMMSESYAGGKLCDKDDLVLNRLKAHLGVFALAGQHGVISPDYTVLKVNQDKIIPKFAEFVLKSNKCRKELRIKVRGITEGFWRLYTDDFYTIYLPVPSLEEQQEILSEINEYDRKNKKLIDNLNQQIILLEEYRTRLISDVVTGQIDVRKE